MGFQWNIPPTPIKIVEEGAKVGIKTPVGVQCQNIPNTGLIPHCDLPWHATIKHSTIR